MPLPQFANGGNPSISRLQIYSYGIVASNKALDSAQIEVTPVEDMPMMDGQITDNVTTTEASGVDGSGNPFQTQVTESGTLTATWMPMGQPNRQTPPDVRRGEQVAIYRFGDADQYFWVTMGSDLALRKLETVIFGFSGTPNEGDSPSADNTYLIGISTHQKRVWMSTTKANGEPYAYNLELDTDNGKFTISDDIGNVFTLDSENHILRAENTDGSFMEINQENFNLFVNDQINMEGKGLNIKTQTMNTEASESITTKTTTQTITATTLHNGNFNTGAGESGDGTMTSSGDFKTTGHMEAQAGISTNGTVKGQTANFQVYENLP
jgi:hypothetical protein